jgi:hypothetical protein
MPLPTLGEGRALDRVADQAELSWLRATQGLI